MKPNSKSLEDITQILKKYGIRITKGIKQKNRDYSFIGKTSNKKWILLGDE